MIITCPQCSVRFQYDESRFANIPSKHFKCTKCDATFEVSNPFPPTPTPESTSTPIPKPARPFPNIQQTNGVSLVFLTGTKSSMAIELINAVTIIGRDDADVATMDPETSKRHAMIEIMDDGSVWLEDLGSTNGTITNGQAITDRVELADRQEFSCGNSAFMVLLNNN